MSCCSRLVRSRPYQRIAVCGAPASSAARISSRWACSSAGSTVANRSHRPPSRSRSTRRACTRSRGSWAHSAYGSSGSRSPGYSAASAAAAARSTRRRAARAPCSNAPTSVPTAQPGKRATRPPASRTASSRPVACRTKCAALRRFAAPAAGDRCGHNASITWSRTNRCPSASASRATSSPDRRVGQSSWVTTVRPTVTTNPPSSTTDTSSRGGSSVIGAPGVSGAGAGLTTSARRGSCRTSRSGRSCGHCRYCLRAGDLDAR